MFPLKDTTVSYTTPYVTYMLIAANIAVFLYQLSLGVSDEGVYFQLRYGLIPKRVFSEFGAFGALDRILPYFTHMFMHGGWFHIISNMYFLYIFGDNVEDKLGHFRFFIMYIIFGLFAGVSQSVIFADSTIPMVGASGALAGVMGAYLVFYPHAKIKTLFIFVIIIFIRDIPAVVFLVIWFFIQVMNGSGSIGAQGGGVAWWAHIGGFVIGLVYAVYFMQTRQRDSRRFN